MAFHKLEDRYEKLAEENLLSSDWITTEKLSVNHLILPI